MSTDSLGNLFDRLRGTVDDVDDAEEQPEPEPEPEPREPEDLPADGVRGVPEYEALVVEVADEFSLEPATPEPTWPMFGTA